MFSPNQTSELISAIKGRGEIPLKFVYISKVGTDRWDKIAKKGARISVALIELKEDY